MKLLTTFIFLSAVFLSTGVNAQISTGTGGEGVTVGDSDLIGAIQYSDSFTIGSDPSTGTRNGQTYSVGSYPLTPQEAILESAYKKGQSTPSFNTYDFSINNDANYVDVVRNGVPFFQTYPGSSGAGSATGFTQTGVDSDTVVSGNGHSNDFETEHGITYGAGTNFVVQSDVVQTNDRVDINIGNLSDTIFSSDGLSIFFRSSASVGLASIGLYNESVGETAAGFASTNVVGNRWNNYAVGFNLNTDLLSIYTNEVLDGTIDLKTFDGGAYANVLDANSNEFVSVGAHVIPPPGVNAIGLVWTDNFQVGTAAPEPTTWAMILSALGLLIGIGRLRRLNL